MYILNTNIQRKFDYNLHKNFSVSFNKKINIINN